MSQSLIHSKKLGMIWHAFCIHMSALQGSEWLGNYRGGQRVLRRLCMLSPRVAWFAHPPFHLHWLTIMQINKTTDSPENFLHWISSVTHSQNCPSVDTEDIRRDILDLWPLQDCAQFHGLTIFILYQWRRAPHNPNTPLSCAPTHIRDKVITMQTMDS